MLNLKTPSRNDVEKCIAALEIEDQREANAIREFYERERQAARTNLKDIAKFVGAVLGLGLLLYALAFIRGIL